MPPPAERAAGSTVVVRGGTALLADGPVRADVVMSDGRIVAVAADVDVAPGDTVIDAGGLMVLPGLIDAHVHFQEPGRTEWEGWRTGSAAAAAGGVTTVIDMPIDSDPPTTTKVALDRKVEAATASSVVDFALWGGLTPLNLDTLVELSEAGVIGFKAFMCPTGWDDFPPVDRPSLDAGFKVAAEWGIPVAVHAELPELFDDTTGLPASSARPPSSEIAAVRLACEVAALHDAWVHIVHVSAAAAAVAAREYAGATVETCPHFLVLEEERPVAAAELVSCCPPIRDSANRSALWDLVRSGGIDWIASDHSPCTPALKSSDDPFPGILGLQVSVPLLLAHTPLELADVVRLMTEPARRLGLRGKGELRVGNDADVVLFDPTASGVLHEADLHMRNPPLSPYVGMAMSGEVVRTFVRGRTAFASDGTDVDSSGRFIPRHR